MSVSFSLRARPNGGTPDREGFVFPFFSPACKASLFQAGETALQAIKEETEKARLAFGQRRRVSECFRSLPGELSVCTDGRVIGNMNALNVQYIRVYRLHRLARFESTAVFQVDDGRSPAL